LHIQSLNLELLCSEPCPEGCRAMGIIKSLKLTMLLHCKPSFVSMPPLHHYSMVLSKTQGAHVTVVQLIAGRLFGCFVKIVLNHDPGT